MISASLTLPDFEPGTVWLCGAGPGDAGLLTLYAHHALQVCDVVVHDALVGDGVLGLAAPHVEFEYAGKRGGRPSIKQVDISRRLIQLAKSGKRVLRLKGGDPFVFARGGEEALALVAAGVAFRVIPGITSGIGGLAYAGIPLTHRDSNSAVTFITGHAVTGHVPDNLDWGGLAKASPVIVFYMAMKHLDQIAARLIAGGKPASTPVAVVAKATTPEMQVLETTLATCVEDVARAAIEPPALVVVGEVVSLRQGLDWLGALGGKTLLADPLGTGELEQTA